MSVHALGPAPHRAATRRRLALAAAAALLLVLAAGHPPAWGAFFPAVDPVQIFFDDFEVDNLATDYTAYQWPVAGWTAHWFDQADLGTVDDAKGGVWGSHMVREDQAWLDRRTALVINSSVAGNPGHDPTEWTNVELQVDVSPVSDEQVGLAWGLHDDGSDGLVDRGYFLYFDTFPDAAQALAGARARWHLVRLDTTWTEVGSGPVELNVGSGDAADQTMVGGGTHVYRVRVRYFCSNLEVQVQRVYNPLGTDAAYMGCGACPSDYPECWCTILNWLESGVSLTPGMAGMYAGGTVDGAVNHRFDNLRVASWGSSCTQFCGDWQGWATTTASLWDSYDPTTVTEKRERLEFKYLYDAALHDYGGVSREQNGRIDNDVFNNSDDQACEGWSLAVDMPDPTAAPSSNQAALQSFLQPMATAVDLLDDEGAATCGAGVLGSEDLCFQDDFDNDPVSPTYNPVPISTYGATPIANSIQDAYDWYVAQRSEGGAWAEDPLAECRRWYIILITDGEESCPLGDADYTAACTAAAQFVDPEGGTLDPVKIFTIGFAGGFTVSGESPVKCVSDVTGGVFKTAANASELASVLYDVINRLDERDRSFSPFKVSPPPSSQGGNRQVRDYLAVFPFFVPREGRSVWDGTLYAFRLNQDQPTLPATGDCDIDFDQVLWDAGTQLTTQVLTSTSADPKRRVYMGLSSSGVWSRYDLATIKEGGDSTLRDAFRDLLALPVPATNLQVQDVVNFLRYMWVDNDSGSTPDPQWPAIAGTYPGGRPIFDPGGPGEDIWSALGDVYHSQPVLVNPPNTSMYYYDYGFVPAGEAGAHDYQLFMDTQSKRRRIALVGANDGMLHAFDAGFFNRDTTDYPDLHDLGTGDELFAYVPQAVFPRLYNLTYGTEQQYLVDGPISVADVFIAPEVDAEPEWRTVALATMRRGGRGVVALDITQPDPISGSDNIPTESVLPGCLDGGGTCSGVYPKVLWEFSDTSDDDANCPVGYTGNQCAPYWDLGWTWSKPAVARIAIYNSSSPENPDDMFVAFFGGGWDRSELDHTGRHIYGVNIETGEIVFKEAIGVSVPGSFTALDSDLDGFHDRIYFGDSDGGLWRISYPAPDDSGATGPDTVANGGGATLTQLYDFSADFAAGGMELRQRFFAAPVTVPAVFDGENFTWALAIGSGDRANLQDENALVDGSHDEVNAFYFVLDVDDTTRGIDSLVGLSYADLTGDFDCSDGSALDPDNSHYGWYLTLRANEKVNFEATVINGHVLFPTFEPTDAIVDSPPDVCGSGSPSPSETPTPVPPTPTPGGPTPTPGTGGPEDVPQCTSAGIGRYYNSWFACGQGEETALNDIITGVEDYTIEGITYVTFTGSETKKGPTEEFVNITGYSASNWRQD